MTHKKDKDLRVRVPQQLHEAVYKEAQSKGMNKSEYVRYILRRETEKDQ